MENNALIQTYKSALKGNILHHYAQFLHVTMWNELNECTDGEHNEVKISENV